MSNRIHVASPDGNRTEAVARAFATLLVPGCIVCLDGGLGAGKTFFTRALLRHLGVTERVTSPTFVLQKIYRLSAGPVDALVHYDLYRIDSYEELLEIGFEELLDSNASFVEWGGKFLPEYPAPVIRVDFAVTGPESRGIRIEADELPGVAVFVEALGRDGIAVSHTRA